MGTIDLNMWRAVCVFVACATVLQSPDLHSQPAPSVVWAISAGGTNDDVVIDTAVDADGSVLVTGYFSGEIQFGQTNLASAGGTDVFLAKASASGQWLWASRLGRPVADYATGVAIGLPNSVFVAARGPTDAPTISKFSAMGELEWSCRTTNISANAVASDTTGNVYITGGFHTPAQFGGYTLTGQDHRDIFVAKLDPAGNILWIRTDGGDAPEEGNGIYVDRSNNVHLTGTCSWSFFWGSFHLPHTDNLGSFIAKYDAAGALLWARKLPGTATQVMEHVVTDSTGNSYVGGGLAGTSLLLARYNPAGLLLWTNVYSDAPATDVVLDPVDSLVAAGSGFSSRWLGKFYPSGARQWTEAQPADTFAQCIAISAGGEPIVAGTFDKTIVLSSTLTNRGGQDIFLVQWQTSRAPEIFAQPTSQTIGEATNVFLTAGVSGSGPMELFWWKDGIPLLSETNYILRNTNVALADGGDYWLVASNAYGCATSLVASLTVTSSVPWLVQQPQSRTVASPDEVRLESAALGSPPLFYQWLRNDAIVAGATNRFLIFTNAQIGDSGNYRVVVTNAFGSVLSTTAVVTVTFRLAEALDTTNLLWQTSEGAPWYSQTNLTHDGIDAARAPGPSAESWLRTTIQGPATLTFWWYGYGALRLDVYAVSSGLTNTYDSPYSYWRSETIFLPAGSNVLQWVAISGWVDEVAYTIGGTPAFVRTHPADQTSQARETRSFSVTANGTPPLSFQWSFAGQPIPGATLSSLTLTNLQPQQSGTYSVSVSNAYGATNSVAHLLVHPLPESQWNIVSGGDGNDAGLDVAVDPFGQAILVGSFSGTASFGSTNATSAGSTDVFLAKYDEHGALQWLQCAGSDSEDVGRGVAFDQDGNIIIAGEFRGTAGFGPTNLTATGENDAFIAKYSPDGNLIWARRAGGASNDVAQAVAVDASNHIYVAGWFGGTTAFGGSNVTALARTNAFISKYNPAGELMWARAFGGTTNARLYDIVISPQGDIYATGFTFSNRLERVVAKWTGNGDPVWSSQLATYYSSSGRSIACDSQGNLYVAGHVENGCSPPHSPCWGTDGSLFSYNPNGSLRWSKRFGGFTFQNDYGYGVAVDGNDRAYVVGKFSGSISLGTVTLTTTNAVQGGAFAACFESNGTQIWAAEVGTIAGGAAMAVALDPAANICITGTNIVSGGNSDVLFAKWKSTFAPKLEILAGEETISLQWLSTLENVSIQTANDLLTAPTWTDVVAVTNRVGHHNTIFVPRTAQQQFFRIKQQ